VLAVLCDFGDRKPGEVVTYIVRRLRALLGADEQRFRDYMGMLEILSENRDLKAQVEEAERMLTEIDVERMPSFVIRLVPVDNSLIFINFMSLLRAKRTDSLTNRFFLLSIWPV